MQPLAASVTDELAALIADPAARVVTPESLGGALAAHLRRLGAREAMLAPLPRERRADGRELMANRLGTGARSTAPTSRCSRRSRARPARRWVRTA